MLISAEWFIEMLAIDMDFDIYLATFAPGMEPSRCNVEIQLADGNTQTTDAKISQAEHPEIKKKYFFLQQLPIG